MTVERNRAFSQNDLLEGENPEIHLNDTFQLYVKNYQQVYQETPGDVLAVALSGNYNIINLYMIRILKPP